MRTGARCFLLALLLILPAWARAQEEPEKEAPPPPPAAQPTEEVTPDKVSRLAGKISAQADFWYVQPAGLDYVVATEGGNTIVPGSPDPLVLGSVLDVGYSAAWRPRYQLSYNLDDDAGTFSGSYWSQDQQFGLLRSDPGNFKYGELLAFPLFAGLFEDGTADAFEAHTRTKHREWRLDYSRRAFDSPRAKGRWLAGWREVNHTGTVEVDYKALNPPPDLFPLPVTAPAALLPFSDEVVSTSGYSGRGPEAGMECQFYLGHSEKFSIDTGFAVALLRGDLENSYTSITSFYGTVVEGELVYLVPPYDAFLGTDPVGQFSVPIGVQEATVATNGTAWDVHLGFRARVWKGIDLTGGFRSSYYPHVGTYIQPANVIRNPSGVYSTQNISHKDSNVVYEGFYMGLGFSY